MGNYLYNPDQKSRDQIKEEFVVRTNIFDDIMSEIQRSDMTKPEQHYLLVGQRGTGKTTMLLRLRYAIEDSEILHSWLLPIGFNEEQYNITELASLWIHIAEYLDDSHGFEGLADEMENLYGNEDFEEKCYEALEKALKKRGKKLVLLIDNIGDLFHKFDEREVRRLREILQTRKYIRLIAGSPFYLDTVLDYSQPFFEFFKVKRLEGLSEKEAQLLLRKLGDVHNEREKIERIIRETPQRIETLRILTSGVPRTIALLFQIFIDHEHESSLKDLMRVLDVVTPLYKHRMDDLPTQQQKIVDAVARNWDAVSVKELASKLRMESKVISAQLRQLEKNQVVEKRQTGTKNHIYLLQDRFWNIWYLMRNGRKRENERVIWLVRFLESWCSNDDFEKRIASFIHQIKEGKLDEKTKDIYGQVYSSLKTLTSRQKFLLKNNIDKSIALKIVITEKDATEEAIKLSGEKKHLEALMAIVETKELSDDGKRLIIEEIENISVEELGKFSIYLARDRYHELSNNDGYLTAILKITSTWISYHFASENIKDASEKIEIIPDILSDIGENASYFDYKIICEIIIYCLLYRKFNLSDLLFEKLNYLSFKEKFKSVYVVSQYFLHDQNPLVLNQYGGEILNSTNDIIHFLNDYWKKKFNDDQM